MKRSLKQFNPEKVAKLEVGMWKAYYNRNFPKLLLLLVNLLHQQFGLNYFYSIVAAYYSGSAAMEFRRTRGDENAKIILGKLINFFKIVSDHSLEKFNYVKAAESELEWWLVDRYPERYSISRIDALKNNMAIVYNTNPDKMESYARYRAEAMIIHDETKTKGADWQKIEPLLIRAYSALRSAIQ
jgi:hypothetical protein